MAWREFLARFFAEGAKYSLNVLWMFFTGLVMTLLFLRSPRGQRWLDNNTATLD
jgi:hypothetical protein